MGTTTTTDDVEINHWLQQLRDFAQRALAELVSTRERLSSVTLDLEEARPLDERTQSLWVDGGSSFLNVVGGSLYVVRGAAGLFRPDEPIRWYERMEAGFTTLPRNVDQLVGLHRDTLEIECMLELLTSGTGLAVLDNGLTSYATMGVPHSVLSYFAAPMPDESPEFMYFQTFVNFMRRFDALIQQCLILGIPLIGAVKDPRSRSYTQQLGLGQSLNDSSAIAMLAGDRIGFTPPAEAHYLEVPRVRQFLDSSSILVDGRGEFMRVFGILKPHCNVFRLDYLRDQQEHLERIRRFAVSMHDGNGYLLPSHIVHRRASIPEQLSQCLADLVISSVAKEDMRAARFIFGAQRRSRFG